MADIAVDATRLKSIRKARKIGRPKLAKLTGLTERQLTKLETAKTAMVAETVLLKVSDALQVPLPALTGEIDVSPEDLQPSAVTTCTSGCCG